MADLELLLQKKLPALNRDYIRGLNRDLSKHNLDDLFGRNVIAVQQKMLDELKQEQVAAEYSREQLQTAIRAVSEAFVAAALKHNRSSCAMSNFPDQHNPSTDYIGDVLTRCERQFDAALNALFAGH